MTCTNLLIPIPSLCFAFTLVKFYPPFLLQLDTGLDIEIYRAAESKASLNFHNLNDYSDKANP